MARAFIPDLARFESAIMKFKTAFERAVNELLSDLFPQNLG